MQTAREFGFLKELGLERYVEAAKLPLERKAPKAKAAALGGLPLKKGQKTMAAFFGK